MKTLMELAGGAEEIWMCLDEIIKTDNKSDDVVKEHLERLSWQLQCNTNDLRQIDEYKRS